MTEAEWDACTDPTPMLGALRNRRKASKRKLRLFGVACWRRAGAWFVPRASGQVFREAAETAERFAEGQATAADLRAAYKASDAVLDTDYLEDYAAVQTARPNAWQAADQTALLSRDFFGKLARDEARTGGASEEAQWTAKRQASAMEGREQARLLHDVFNNPFRRLRRLPPAILAWNDGAVRKMAQAIYDERAFDRLPLLADALEDAGCADAAILAHCRGPGEHVRGCWVVDLLLGKT